jgi:1,4-alpha-glucan branching enzyme
MKVFKRIAEKALRLMVSDLHHQEVLDLVKKWMMGWMHDALKYFQKKPCTGNTIKMILTFR